MNVLFGNSLRELRIKADVRLRELARSIGKSPGYISDVEQGKVPPPSEEVIVEIAKAIGADRQMLLKLAHKVDPELTDYVTGEPMAADFLRMTKHKEFKEKDWEKLSQLAELANLGKPGKLK